MKSYFDIAGDGGSRVIEQVTEQRERIAERLAGVRHIVAVGSGKGGVGKSTLSAELARALRADGAEVALLDADVNGPCQARLAGIQAAPLVPGAGGLELPRRADGVRVASVGSLVAEGAPLEFPSVAAGDAQVWRATREFAFLGQLLAAVAWGEVDYLLVDLPPGAERTAQFAGFLGPGASVLLVTIPSALARGVVARSLGALAGSPGRVLGYVENMSGYHCPECATLRPLFPAGDGPELDLPCLGRVPFDPELAAACDRGLPSASGGAAERAVRGVARRLSRAVEAPS